MSAVGMEHLRAALERANTRVAYARRELAGRSISGGKR